MSHAMCSEGTVTLHGGFLREVASIKYKMPPTTQKRIPSKNLLNKYPPSVSNCLSVLLQLKARLLIPCWAVLRVGCRDALMRGCGCSCLKGQVR